MAIGKEYLVSAARERYAVLAVNVCNRTRPLNYAKVDLRTLDGSPCDSPGATIIGYVRKGNGEFLQIIAQALAESIPVVTSDEAFRPHKGLKVIW